MPQYPLVLSHPQIRRITERKARALVLTRRLPLGTIEIHDALTNQRNARARRRGRVDLQEDPLAMTIEIDAREECPLGEIAFKAVRRAGFLTTEDFFADWTERRRKVDRDLAVFVYDFHHVEAARYLAARIHRGYTSNPSQGIFGEPEALSDGDLEVLSRRSARRAEDEEEFRKRARRSIGLRAKDAAARGDLAAYKGLASELALLVEGTGGTAFGTAAAV